MGNKDKIILDLCGGTGSWSKPYEDAGYKVINITLPEFDVRKHLFMETKLGFVKAKGGVINIPIENIYGILCAPPCTMFSVARTRAKKPRNLREGMELVIACLKIIWQIQFRIKKDTQRIAPLRFWALENPYGLLNWFLGKPAFIFNPYEFGDGYSKKTCLWGTFNEPKKLKKYDRKEKKKFDMLLMKELKEIRSIGDIVWKNTKTRQELRAITPPKFAQAFFEANK